MSKKLNTGQIEELVERLPMQDKIKLAAQLDRETWDIRFGRLVKEIRQKAKKSSISERGIRQACQRARARLYHGEN